MLFLSISCWCIVVYSFRVALRGNPLYTHLAHAQPEFLAQVERVAMHERGRVGEQELRFLQVFSRLTLLELALCLVEIALLVYLWLSRNMEWLALALLIKDLAMLALSAAMARLRVTDSLFQSLLALPRWLIWADRASALISGVGFLVLFLGVNEVRFW